ncbi:MAG: sulfatase [Myxococcales bacterium]
MVDEGRRKVLRLLATTPLLSGATVGLLGGCEGDSAGESNQPAPGIPGSQRAKEGSDPAAKSPVQPREAPWAGRRAERSLIDQLSFASLSSAGGLLLDFGSTDSFKYTFGGWRSGWGKHVSRDGVSYTHATTTTSRIYFPWDKSEALKARFRIQRVASKFFSLYVNSKPVEKVDITRVDWTTYESTIPAELVQAGVNHVLLRWETTTPAMGEDVAAAVDYVHFAPVDAPAPKESELPRHASLVGKVGDSDALLLGAGTRLSYWMQVPEKGKPMLGFIAAPVASDDAGEGKSEAKPEAKTEANTEAKPLSLVVTAHRDGESPEELLTAEIGGTAPQALAATLAGLTGEPVRLDLSVRGSAGRVAVVEPTVYVEPDEPAPKPARPAKNAIVVMIDTLRADHVSAYADTRVKAPALDAFAKGGVVFERYSAVEDWTKPSCATMLTGLYPCTHKTESDAAKLPESVRMVTEELQDRNVATGGFCANGYVSGKFGFEKGWDTYTNYIRETKPTEAEYVFKDAYDWIEKKQEAGERFYAYVQTIDPHVPYDPPDEFLKMYDPEPYDGGVKPRSTAQLLEDIKKGKFEPTARDKARIRALYDGEISYHDKWFGDFMDKLDAAGVLEDTLVIVVSDHGEEFWEHGNVGHGHQIHQELIHVPFIMSWKGSLPAGKRVAANSDHCSLVPTLFDAMGLKPPDYLEAQSVLGAARGEAAPSPAAGFSTHQGEREAAWSGRFKLLQRGPIGTYLYDVENDRTCQNNLEDSHPITLTCLRAVLGQFQGAENKARWRSRHLEQAVAMKVDAENVEMDPETSEQLKALGYFR